VAGTDSGRWGPFYRSGTMTTYAVKWREPDGQTFVGRLALGPRALRLIGRGRGAGGSAVERRIGYDELRGLRIGSRGAERLDGRPSLVVDRADGSYLVADAGLGAPVVQELADRLTDLRREAPHTATVVVPLRQGALARVLELVAQGPPFDPDETPLIRHELLLTEREAILRFEAATEDGLAQLLGSFDLAAAVAAWGELVAGPPRLAATAYAWERPELPGVGLGF
jgi:hypothetical protein